MLFFHHEPGLLRPQWGQRSSYEPMSLPPLGQRIDPPLRVAMIQPTGRGETRDTLSRLLSIGMIHYYPIARLPVKPATVPESPPETLEPAKGDDLWPRPREKALEGRCPLGDAPHSVPEKLDLSLLIDYV